MFQEVAGKFTTQERKADLLPFGGRGFGMGGDQQIGAGYGFVVCMDGDGGMDAFDLKILSLRWAMSKHTIGELVIVQNEKETGECR